jgi:hypothetical protein
MSYPEYKPSFRFDLALLPLPYQLSRYRGDDLCAPGRLSFRSPEAVWLPIRAAICAFRSGHINNTLKIVLETRRKIANNRRRVGLVLYAYTIFAQTRTRCSGYGLVGFTALGDSRKRSSRIPAVGRR